ncbi:MAG: class I SAM-dependent methyltransferase [Desulfuromonadales bacterium]|nr:class I SAM-dependent methyltransferase [Desulfuromonadales bacterium]
MESDRVKWNQRYSVEQDSPAQAPAPFLVQEIERIAGLVPGKRALDIACGEGRNSIFLAQHGFSVTGIDISNEGIALARRRADQSGVVVDFLIHDLDSPFIEGSFDLIINFNFLLRTLIPEAFSLLVPGGVFVFETLLETPPFTDSHNPAFFLKQGELKQLFQPLYGQILLYEEYPHKQPATARLLFRKGI